MKKRWIALLLIMMLLPVGAFAAQLAEEDSMDAAEQEMPPEVAAAVEMINEALATADFDQQMALLMDAAKEAPDDIDIQLICAELIFYLDYQDAYAAESEAILRAAVEKAKDGESGLYAAALQELVDQLSYAGRFDEAGEMVADALAETPDDPQLLTLEAAIAFYQDDSARALTLLENLLDEAPESQEALNLYAQVLSSEYRWDDALAAYKEIDEKFPEYLDGLYGQYGIYIASGRFDQGVRMLDTLLGNGAGEELWLDRARVRLWNQYLPEQALEESEALLRRTPNDVDASMVKMISLLMLERYDEAELVADAISLTDMTQGDLMRSIILMEQGQWTQAEEKQLDILSRQPEAYGIWRYVSSVRLSGFDDVDGALDAMGEAFAITEGYGNFDLFMQLGHVYRRDGDLLEAARAYATADSYVGDDPSALYYLAMTCMDAGREEDTVHWVEQMELRYPGWYETLLARALLEDTLANTEEALTAYMALVEIFPFPAAEMVSIEGLFKAAAGDETAVALIEEQIAADGEEAALEDRLNLSQAQILMGDLDDAKATLEAVQDDMPEDTPDEARHRRDLAVSIALVSAELAFAQDDTEGTVEAFGEAVKLGWPPHQLKLDKRFAELCETEAFETLAAMVPDLPNNWDLGREPTIPR